MKLIAILGSPRSKGNSALLLENFLNGTGLKKEDCEIIHPYKLKISACDEGNSCYKTGLCVKKDDMQDIYKKLFNAKYVVIATPVFFMGVPSRLKAIIDRCQAVWAKKYVLKEKISSIDNRKGFLVSVSGLKNKKDVFTGTINTIKAFFHVLEIEYSGNLLCNGFDSTEKLAKESKLLENIRKAGKEFIRSV